MCTTHIDCPVVYSHVYYNESSNIDIKGTFELSVLLYSTAKKKRPGLNLVLNQFGQILAKFTCKLNATKFANWLKLNLVWAFLSGCTVI